MRIIAGLKKGWTLRAPKGLDVRPTLDRVKESIFGIIQFDIYGKTVLDLFAGSGALGLEALSRGAARCTFCDHSHAAIDALRANIEKLGFQKEAEVLEMDFEAAIQRMRKAKFDIVFLDPPYGRNLYEKAIRALLKANLLNDGFMIIAEHDAKQPVALPEGVMAKDMRRYGDIAVTIVKEDA